MRRGAEGLEGVIGEVGVYGGVARGDGRGGEWVMLVQRGGWGVADTTGVWRAFARGTRRGC